MTHELIQEGLRHKRQGNIAEARKSFRAVLDLDAKNEWAIVELSNCADTAEERESILRDGLRDNPAAANILSILSDLLVTQDKYDEATEFAVRAMKIDQTTGKAHSQYIRLLAKTGRFGDIPAVVDAALSTVKDPAWMIYEASIAHATEHRDRVNPQAPVQRDGKPIDDAVIVSMVKDEEDIILGQLRHHYRIGFRYFAIADNGSTDQTANRIHQFRQQHPDARVLYVFDPVVAYTQSIKTTALARYAVNFFKSESAALKWVFALDADEFLCIPKQNADLNSFLHSRAEKLIFFGMCNTTSNEPLECTPGDADLLSLFNVAAHYNSRPVLKVAYRFEYAAKLEMGNHTCSDLITSSSQVYHAGRDGIYLRHLPLRSFVQVKSKIINGGKAIEADANISGGSHWRQYYERYKQEGDNYIRQVLRNHVIGTGLESAKLNDRSR